MSSLVVREVSVDLAGRPVLRDVSLTVSAGQLVGLLGPNGAGKTTLLRATLGLVPLRAGRIDVDDDVPGRRGRRDRRTIGYVPQRHEFAWDFPISVERTVLTGRTGARGSFSRTRVEDWRAVADALDLVELGDLRRRPVGQLSGGQRQRVLVARALALEPQVLLLDEPFTGLDLPTQELLSDLFAALAADGRAVLMTTHDLLGAVATCHRLALLDGRIVAEGTPAELRHADPWRTAFGIGADNPLLRALEVA